MSSLPETAEVDWCYVQTLDPYGVFPDLPEEYWQAQRGYFARAPNSDVWVEFGDLPRATREALWKKHGRKVALPSLADLKHFAAIARALQTRL